MIDILLAFAAMFVIEICFAVYVLETAAYRPIRAGVMASAIFIAQALLIRGYVANPDLVWPAALGAFVGTVVTIVLYKALRGRK